MNRTRRPAATEAQGPDQEEYPAEDGTAGQAGHHREGHLIFDWLPLDQLADADVRPDALKNALLAGGPPFWRPWGG